MYWAAYELRQILEPDTKKMKEEFQSSVPNICFHPDQLTYCKTPRATVTEIKTLDVLISKYDYQD